jgi:hypothetical protein
MKRVATNRWSIAMFSVTILVSAFLLFQVQPLVSKVILPWFGGCPAVWTTCMLFFEVALFAGYLYAHLLQQWLRPRHQMIVHLALVVVAMALLPIAPSSYWKPIPGTNPTWQILLLLSATVGLPYFALSGTSPLVQAWFSGVWPERSPYRLYALSNFGSLAALLSYPFLFEPAFELSTQSILWSWAFVLYGVLCAAILMSSWRLIASLPKREKIGGSKGEAADVAPTWLDRFRWLALPACASLLLLAATNHICQDIASVPFLWVMPLSLYLLTFIICFEHERWYTRRLFSAAVVLSLLALSISDIFRLPHPLSLPMELAQNFMALFFACMLCHGELAKLKPSPRHLTEFYLMIAAGGAIGGLFVAVIAPLVFSTYIEWQIGIIASFLLALGLLTLPGRVGKRGVVIYSLLSPPAVFALASFFFWGFDAEPPIDRARNFFGVVTVKKDTFTPEKSGVEKGAAENIAPIEEILLVHGRISHGRQFTDQARRDWPTSYYGETSGVGKSIRWFQKSGPIRVGAVGLGTGTLATYAKPGDVFRFYEINPDVVRMAKKHFTFLADCRGKLDIVMGDARLSLESELKSGSPQKFDVLAVDAFSSDSIPTHLLTREAFEVYRQHLAPGGVIAVHVSNNFLRLAPVVRRLAEAFGMQASRIYGEGDDSRLLATNYWVLVTENKAFLKAHPSDPLDWGEDNVPAPLWTDQYSNLYQILKSP